MEGRTELERNATAEARRSELKEYQRALDMQWLDSRTELGRTSRCLALVQREADAEREHQERTDRAAVVEAVASREAQLASTIDRVRRDADCEIQRRRAMRENDPNLRELTRRLTAGYVRRDQHQQILHNEYRRLQDQAAERQADAALAEAVGGGAAAHAQRERRLEAARAAHLRDQLRQQLAARALQRQCQDEDTLIEKKMLDDVIRTLADEDRRELEQAREQQQRLRDEMVQSLEARAACREQNARAIALEERRLQEQCQAADDRASALIAEREQKLLAKEELNRKIAAKIQEDEARRAEREDIIRQLQEQERLERDAIEDERATSRDVTKRRDTHRALTDQIDARRRQAEQQRLIDVRYREETALKIAAEEKKERAKADSLRSRGREYAQALLRQASGDVARRRATRHDDDDILTTLRDYHQERQRQVAEERERILAEHGPPLNGFVRKGVLTRNGEPGGEGKGHPKRNAQCQVLRQY